MIIHPPLGLSTCMGLFVIAENKLQGTSYNMDQTPGKMSGLKAADGACSSSSTRVQRKTIEKNRRNKMKGLCSMLNSLVPNSSNEDPKEAKSLPDQIDEAAKYIKYLEVLVDEAKKKKVSLMVGPKRLHDSTMDTSNPETLESPKLDIRFYGSALDVTLICGVSDESIFSDVIRVLHKERAQVLNANFSIVGNSVYHLIHAEIGQGAEAAAITERLKRLVNGSSSTDTQQLHQQHNLLDFEISPNIWEFDMFHAWHFN